MKPILSVRGLNKIFPNGVHALNDVSFDVQEGEFLVVIGLSGSGKSTLLRCLNRLYDPTSGEIHFHSTRVDQVQGRQLLALRRQIAMIFQSFNLVPRSTVLINVLSGRLARIPTWRSLCKFFSPAERESALKRLDLVGLREKAAQRADQLSGGQQQRVAIARALNQEPRILLADEPVASLDPATSFAVMDCLRRAHRELGVTIICNLHFLSLVREYATRVIALRAGRIVFEGSPQEIDGEWFQKIYGEAARDLNVQ